MTEKKREEVVVAISNVGGETHYNDHDHELKGVEYSPRYASKSPPLNCASPEIRFIPSPNKPPKVPTTNENLTPRKNLARSVYSKPKSRFGEQPYPIDETLLEENVTSTFQEQLAVSSPYRNSFNKAAQSPNNKSGTVNRSVSITSVVTPRTPLMASPGPAGEDDFDEIIYRKVELSKGKRKRLTTKVLIELFVFVCIAGSLVASLTIEELRRTQIWSLALWRWCMLAMVTFCGMCFILSMD
ncbi:mechanosensitive ion channel protein 10-like [Trifolium pratense]|uniref:Mechanosensitive ion channel protein 10-like n=1 Tax=Trifolium pratense TaxID=57577 RepID=A0A2K3LUK9_TRIPR|nr:mechanosensitive ion channel protein 10-like [Trifolium pratense]